MNDDATLLRRYVEDGSESAFTELVRARLDLVYGAALRRTGAPDLAADVAQQVFTALARQARSLCGHPALGAWLHTATRNAALNLMTAERRRKTRERAAFAPESVAATETPPDPERLRPLLDAAIDDLPEADRVAVVLRFLEHRSWAEVGAALRVSEDAARVRTARALDKLRTALAGRGITSTAAALGTTVAACAATVAPAGLANSLAVAALASAAGGAGVFAPLFLAMNLKVLVPAAFSAVLFFLLGTWVGVKQLADTPIPAPVIESHPDTATIAALRDENLKLQADLESARQELRRATTIVKIQPPPPPSATPAAQGTFTNGNLRAVLNNLRQISAARDQYVLENGHPASSIRELVGENAYIRQLISAAGEDYSGLSMDPKQPLTVSAPDGTPITFDPNSGNGTNPSPPSDEELAASKKLEPAGKAALAAYRAAHNGSPPRDPRALLPYFATPQEGADYLELLEMVNNQPLPKAGK